MKKQVQAIEVTHPTAELRARGLMLLAEAYIQNGQWRNAVAPAREAVQLLDPDSALGFDAVMLLIQALYWGDGTERAEADAAHRASPALKLDQSGNAKHGRRPHDLLSNDQAGTCR